jgi:cysteinyl-tRNA synthetase
MHNGLVTLGGDKMSKSLGNTLSVGNLLDQVRPPELRYYLAAPHYRSSVDFTAAALDEAATAYRRIEGFVVRALELVGAGIPEPVSLASFPPAFVDAMNDDVGVPQALAVLHNTVREGNAELADGDKARVGGYLRHVLAMLSVLGLDPVGDAAATRGSAELRSAIDGLVALALEQRTAARERKDYAAADAIRDQLAAAGIIVEDTAAGARWQLRRD